MALTMIHEPMQPTDTANRYSQLIPGSDEHNENNLLIEPFGRKAARRATGRFLKLTTVAFELPLSVDF